MSNRREYILRDIEIKFVVASAPEGRTSSMPPDKSYVHLILEDHPQEPELTNLVWHLLSMKYEDNYIGPLTLDMEYYSSPIRKAMQIEGKPEVDARRMLRTTINRARVPLLNPNVGRVSNAIHSLWSGQVVDVQLDLFRTNIFRPFSATKTLAQNRAGQGSRTILVYANAMGFKLKGGVPKGLENLI